MLRWMNPTKPPKPPDGLVAVKIQGDHITDDPLAAIESGRDNRTQNKIYSVSRVNPLFVDNNDDNSKKPPSSHRKSPPSREKSTSSGYGGSNRDSSLDPIYHEHLKLMEDVGVILEQNPAFVKSIRIAARGVKINSTVPSHSSSSGGGTLSTIPEGKVDQPIPKPIWPLHDRRLIEQYDSLVDDALLLYTSLSYMPDKNKPSETYLDISVKDLLMELLNSINDTLEGKNNTAPEDMLKMIDEKIRLKLELLKHSSEEEMKRLCLNLSNCRKKNSVLRALSNSSSSGTSRVRTISSETEDIYQLPSGSSNSDFSDSLKEPPGAAVFVHDDLGSVPNLVRNTLIYGTLCRAKVSTNEALLKRSKKISTFPKKSLLQAVNDNKPSVWEQYYGVKAVEEGEVKFVTKPTDVPLYPGGRPEADFTLDIPRSEHLMKRMKEDKKWRCRCRLLTSFLGLIFFLLSVMAVSLILTRGKRMFGSMV
ncbi:uncharacterized protein isoform X2 [Leptinotarsa decemlineata]|uniref:uncharacterized protein isoform X2 n=1 Tax=Leptinotarsa decemlineata TaxID=7539 RepID=UPI003D30CAAA